MLHKKQLFDIVEGICVLNNSAWGNPHGSYDDATESAYPIEEALEGFTLPAHGMTLASGSPKQIARDIMKWADSDEDAGIVHDVDRFDKHLDAIYFAVGSLHKLGLTPPQIVEGLQVVHTANEMKGGKKDASGKVIKPDQWQELYAPEPQLQAILDRRTT